MAATWKTKWGVRRVRRDTPTIEEALIAAESLANDPGQRAEIAASLMGVPVDEVRVLAAKQAAKTRGRASLVAHSGGGIVASAVAERFPEQVSRIAYIAGMMLPSGMAFADLVAELKRDYPDAGGVGPHLTWSRDRLTSRVPIQVALAYFFHDCPTADAALAAQKLTPQPDRGRAIRAKLTPQRFGRIPRLYVEAEADRAVIPPLQRRMQALVPGADVVTLPTGHAPHLAAPRLLADVLTPFLTGSEDGPAFAAPIQGRADKASGSRQRRGAD